MWWIAVSLWVAVGWVGFFWWPTAHESWSRMGRVVLWIVIAFMLGYLGPFGLWMSIRSARSDTR